MRRVLVAAILALAFSACEKESGSPVDVSFTSPFVSGSLVVHDTINLDDTSSTAHVVKLPNGRIRVTDTLITQVSSPLGFGDIAAVTYKLYAPGETGNFAQGHMSFNGNHPTPTSGEYVSAVSFDVERSDAGRYVVEISAENSTGNGGNASLLSLFLTRNNSRPRLFNLVLPDTIQRPTVGYNLVTFSVAASDSDGYRDLQLVFLKLIAPVTSSNVPLFDDGDVLLHGDMVSGDGVFSVILSINGGNTLGDKTFLFQAQDRSGALSDTLLHTITIVQGP